MSSYIEVRNVSKSFSGRAIDKRRRRFKGNTLE